MATTAHSMTARDRRFMAAAIRLSRWHLGRTGTNPSVATLIVDGDGQIVGRGITALGGRPHAEAQALGEAGDRASGATAYVTLEPCAHHGRTPPCAEALVAAGVARVVAAVTDPDERVAGKGFAILAQAGVEITHPCLSEMAETVLGGYLNRSLTKQVQVTLKLAVSADGMIGRTGEGQVAITGEAARAQSHILRAQHDAILIGSGTAAADNPALTCRLPGLEDRSPARIVVDTHATLPPDSTLVRGARDVPLHIATTEPLGERARALGAAGADIIACAPHEGRVALPELMQDLAARGFTSVLAEGGAQLAASLLADGLVGAIKLFESDVMVGADGIASPVTSSAIPEGFALMSDERFGDDRCLTYVAAAGA